LRGIEIVVVLVVLLCGVELFELFHFCHYFCGISWIFSLGCHLPNRADCCISLLLVFVENDRAVLSAGVVALSVQGGGVMDVQENVKQGLVIVKILL
jgi:hypothetical protein